MKKWLLNTKLGLRVAIAREASKIAKARGFRKPRELSSHVANDIYIAATNAVLRRNHG